MLYLANIDLKYWEVPSRASARVREAKGPNIAFAFEGHVSSYGDQIVNAYDNDDNYANGGTVREFHSQLGSLEGLKL